MAQSKPVQGNELFEKDIFSDPRESGKKLLPVLDGIERGLKDILETQSKILKSPSFNIKTSKDYRAANKAINESSKARKALQSIQEQRIKIEQKLKQARSNEIDQLNESKLALQEQNRINKDFVKSKSPLLNQYQREEAQLRILINRYRGIAAEQGVFSAEAIKLGSEISELDGKLKQIRESSGQFQHNVGNYPKVIQVAISNLNNLEKELEDLKRSGKGSADEIKALQGRIDKLGKETTNSIAEFNKTGKETNNILSRMSAGFKNLLISLGVVTGITAFVQAFKKAFGVVVDFDSALIKVQKTANLTDLEKTTLGASTIQLSRDLKSISTDKLLELQEVAGQLGVKGADNLLRFSETLARLEKSTNIIGAEGATEVARILNITGEDIDTVDRFGAALVDLGNNSAASEKEILNTANEVARATSAYSLASKTVLGVSAALTSLGAKPESAGTAIGTFFAKIEKAVLKGGTDLDRFSKIVGVSSEELIALFDKDKEAVFVKFFEGLNKIQKSGGSVTKVLGKLGLSSRGVIKNLAPLAANSEVLANAVQRSTEAYTANIALLDESNKSFEGLQAKVDSLAVSWANYILTLENGEGPVARFIRLSIDVVNRVLEIASGVEKAKTNLSDYEKGVNNIVSRIILFSKVLGVLITSFISYRVAVRAARAISILFSSTMAIARVAVAAFSGGLKSATAVVKGFNVATKANVIGVIVTLITTATTAFLAFRDGASAAAKAQREYNDAQLESQRIASGAKSLSELESVRRTLSDRQLADAQQRVEDEIKAVVDKNTQLLIVEKQFADKVSNVYKELEENKKGLSEDERLAEFLRLTEIFAQEKKVVDERVGLDKQELDRLKDKLFRSSVLFEEERLRRLKIRKDITKSDVEEDEKEIKRSKDLKEIKVKDLKDYADERKRIQRELEEDLQRRFDENLKKTLQSAEESRRAGQLLEDQRIREDNARIERIQGQQNLLISVEQELTKILERESSKRVDLINREIEARRRAIDVQADLAKQGLANELADQEARLDQAEGRLRDEREQQANREEAIKLAQLYLQSYLSRLEAGEAPTTAGTGAFSDALKAKAIATGIAQIPGFYEGTESVEKSLGSPVIPGRDGYILRADGKERIFNGVQNKKIGNIKNDEAADVLYKYRMGKLGNNSLTENQVDRIVKAIEKSGSQISEDVLGNIVLKNKSENITYKKMGKFKK